MFQSRLPGRRIFFMVLSLSSNRKIKDYNNQWIVHIVLRMQTSRCSKNCDLSAGITWLVGGEGTSMKVECSTKQICCLCLNKDEVGMDRKTWRQRLKMPLLQYNDRHWTMHQYAQHEDQFSSNKLDSRRPDMSRKQRYSIVKTSNEEKTKKNNLKNKTDFQLKKKKLN